MSCRSCAREIRSFAVIRCGAGKLRGLRAYRPPNHAGIVYPTAVPANTQPPVSRARNVAVTTSPSERAYVSVPSSGPVEVPGSACLPNWRIGDLQGPFDVFVNSFSFQEMEPEVVQRYVDTVVGLGVSYVVSLNSRKGKHVAQDEADIGVLDPVTSSRIVAMFEAHGYKLCGAYNSPLVAGAGELVVLSRV